MKKISKAVDQEVDPLEDAVPVVVDERRFYGAKDVSGQIGFITRERYCGKNFCLRCARNFTNGNGWDYYDIFDNLKDMINNLISSKQWSVYEFKSFQELMEWVIKNDKSGC